MKRVEVILRFPVNDEVTVSAAADFAANAVEMYGGSFRPPGGYGEDDPGDPLFGSKDVEIVQSRRIYRNRRRKK